MTTTIERSASARLGGVPTIGEASAARAPANAGRDEPAAASLLPEPASILVGGDAGEQIEALVLASATEDRLAARKSRDAEEALAASAEAMQLAAMQERADETYTASMIGAAGSAAAGVTIAGGIAAPDVAKPAFQAGEKMIDASAKAFGAVVQRTADEANIEATHQEQLAGRFHRGADEQRDRMKAARELSDRAIAFYKEYVAARAETQKAALFRA